MQAIEKKYCGAYKIGEFYEGAVKTNKKTIPLTAAIFIVNDSYFSHQASPASRSKIIAAAERTHR